MSKDKLLDVRKSIWYEEKKKSVYKIILKVVSEYES